MQISINNVRKKFKSFEALKGIEIDISKKECIGIIGPNGAGKTTLLKIITGIIDPTNGDVTINGNPVLKEQNNIGYLPQYPKFHDWMNVYDVLEFYAKLSGIKSNEIESTIDEMLELVKLTEFKHKNANRMSGGMKQRLGIAQAMINKPKLVILDEPVSSLDPLGRREVLNLIKSIKDDATIIFSTHILSDAEEVCDRFCLLKQGTLLDDFYVEDKIASKTDNIVSIEVVSGLEEWESKINSLPFVKNYSKLKNTFHIEITDSNYETKNHLLKSLVEARVDFSQIEFSTFSLEKYFLEMVGDSDV